MKFDEAYKHYMNDEKVRRESWKNKNYYLGDINCPECRCEIDYEDALADDWIVCKPRTDG